MLPITVPDSFRIIAHRGASGYAPENTFAAFQLAFDMGVREVELDAQLAADGVVVLCHDKTLERYGHGGRTVEDVTSGELLALDMGSWFSPFLYQDERAITLESLFGRYRDKMTYHVEIKGEKEALPETVCRLIRDAGLGEKCIVTSFSDMALERVRAADPGLRRAWLVDAVTEETVARAKALECFQLCPAAGNVDREGVARGRKAFREVRAWGIKGDSVQALALANRALDAGCDGMTINWPDWLIHARDTQTPRATRRGR